MSKILFWFLLIGTIIPYTLFVFSMAGTELEGVGAVLIAPAYILLDFFGLLALWRKHPSGYALLFISNIIKVFAVVVPGIKGLVVGSVYKNTPEVIYGYVFLGVILVAIVVHALILRRQVKVQPVTTIEKAATPKRIRVPNKFLRFPLQVLFAIILLALGFIFQIGSIVKIAIVILIAIFVIDRARSKLITIQQ